MARDDALVHAAYSYRIVPLDAPAAPVLTRAAIAGGALAVAGHGKLTALACVACTLGPALERRFPSCSRSAASRSRWRWTSWARIVVRISRRAQDRMQAEVSRSSLTMSGELRAGDPGWH